MKNYKKYLILACVSIFMIFPKGVKADAALVSDLNKDGVVDTKDLAIISTYYNQNVSQYDFNKDGVVDLYDIIKLSSDMGQREPIKAVVQKSSLNLRPKPDKNTTSNITIPANTPIEILNRTNGLYYVLYNKDGTALKGYVTRYVDIIEDTLAENYLGYLSEVYEVSASGGPETIANNSWDKGGKSYGSYQLSSKMGSLSNFLLWLKHEKPAFYNPLNVAREQDLAAGIENGFGDNFDRVWVQIARESYDEFFTLQHRFIKVSYYDILLKYMKSVFDFTPMLNKSFALRNVFWSMAVQHGPTGAKNMISKYIDKTSIPDLITALYDERSKIDIYYKYYSPEIRQALLNRFIKEKEDALRGYGYEQKYLK